MPLSAGPGPAGPGTFTLGAGSGRTPAIRFGVCLSHAGLGQPERWRQRRRRPAPGEALTVTVLSSCKLAADLVA